MIEKQAANGDRLTLGYDGANRLVRLTRASERGRTVDATYRYDGLGRRISKTMRHENGTTATTHYGWDGDRIVREESESQHSTIVYEPGSFVPMLRIDGTQEGPQLSAFVTDAIGTPMQLVAAHGETQWQGQPDDWAAVKNARGSARQPIRFQGQWQDEESGLYYNRHRYYDPPQGRYISQDPIGLRGGTNLYGYVANPMEMVDPLGLEGMCTHENDSFHPFVPDEVFEDYFQRMESLQGRVDQLESGAYYRGVSHDINSLRAEMSDLTDDLACEMDIFGINPVAPELLLASGAGLARAGWSMKFYRYTNAGGGGLNLFKSDRRMFAVEYHKFKYNGIEKARLHYHRGATKSQMRKHRPYQGGW
ncbi:RHS repeat-associated core domain-containing protein [Vreelandella sp. TE19]